MSDADELLAELRRLAQRFPLPHPMWHRFVPEMHDVVRDLLVALDAIALHPGAQAELVRRVEEASEPPDTAGGSELAAARRRLQALPVPEGEHPYLDEIRVTLEAAETALAALAAAGGDDVFASRLP